MRLIPLSTIALLAAIALPAHAQDAATADETFPTEQANADAANGVVARHGDWQIRCPGESNRCVLFVPAFDPEGNEVANITFQALPEDSAAVLGTVVVTPLLTLLPRGLTMGVDDGVPASYPYGWCDPAGCYSRFGMTAGQVDAMKAGTNAYLRIFTIVNPDTEILANISLTGFTAAVEDLQSR